MNTETNPASKNLKLVKVVIPTVVLVVAGVLVIGFHFYYARENAKAARINCNRQLRSLGISFRGFGIDLGGFPMTVSTITNAPDHQTPGMISISP